MRYAIISDVHGNLPALEAVLADMDGDFSRLVCLGDVVNYGPWNDECLELIDSIAGCVYLRGNHEDLFLGTARLEDEIDLVQQFTAASFRNFTRRDLLLKSVANFRFANWFCQHTLAGAKVYRDTPVCIESNTLLGHTHHAFKVMRGDYWLVNPGSVGQNRAKLDRACYAIVDSEAGTVELREVGYDVSLLMSEVKSRAYPEACLAYLSSKLSGS